MADDKCSTTIAAQRTRVNFSRILSILAVIFLGLTIVTIAFFGVFGLIFFVILLLVLAMLITVLIYKELRKMS